MFKTASGEEIFVIDGHVHNWDARKANQKNVQLLNAWAERPHKTQRASGLFLAGLTAALIGFFAACGFLTYLFVRWLVG